MGKVFWSLCVFVGMFVFPQYAMGQMTIVKYIPKYVDVEPVFNYWEHMEVVVVGDRVVEITRGGQTQRNLNEDWALALHRWEKEAWKMVQKNIVVFGFIERKEYVFQREVFKSGKPESKETKNRPR